VAEFDGGETGATPTRFCRSCGTKLSDPAGRFCQSCGAEVGSGPKTAIPEPTKPSGPSAQQLAAEPEPAPELAATPTGEPPSTPEAPTRKRSRWWVLVPFAIVTVIASGVILLAGGSSGSNNSSQEGGITTLPSPSELPPQTVAIVTHVPSALGTVTQAELTHAIALSAASAGLDSPPGPGSTKYAETAETALATLLEPIWIQGEAEERGLVVTSSEVSKKRAKIEREEFKSEGQYRKFLAESHYTKTDVRERVKVQLLGSKIQRELEGESEPPHSQRARERALSDFETEFSSRWRSRTVCQPTYAIEKCSNGPAPPQASSSKQSAMREAASPNSSQQASCKKPDGPVAASVRKTRPKIEVPDCEAPAKLVVNELERGTGAEAESGDEVSVQYAGLGFESGKEFDASWNRNEPFKFKLGAGQVIAGWDRGVEGMKVGGRRELVIPPGLAYGEAGSPPSIGPNETLVFVIDLLAVK
jgi:peptidylprolyl isomerase